MARVLVACERSGIVRRAFRARGHEAWSCDLVPGDDGGEHIQGDVRPVLRESWDLVIAHPPCNYLSHLNAWLGNKQRDGFWNKCVAALDFFMECYEANAPRVAVENPQPMRVVTRFIGKPDDQVEPWHFGDPYRKRTWLWLRGLPPLVKTVSQPSTNIANWVDVAPSKHFVFDRGEGVVKTQQERAQFWPGIAAAMADQWGAELA